MSLPAFFSVHLSGAFRELHHVVVLSLELLLVVVAVGLEVPDDLVKGLGSLAETVVVETLDAEGDDTRQNDVLLLDVHLFLGLLRVLFVSQDVAQLGAEDLDGSSLALGNDGESIGVDLTRRRDGDVNDDGDFLFLEWWRGHFLRRRCSLTLGGGGGLGGGCLTLGGGGSLGGGGLGGGGLSWGGLRWCGLGGSRFCLLGNRLEGLNDLGRDRGLSAIGGRGRRHRSGEGSRVRHVRLLAELLLHGRRRCFSSWGLGRWGLGRGRLLRRRCGRCFFVGHDGYFLAEPV